MAQRLLRIGVKPDARNGIAGTARVLLSYGANVDACDKRSMATPLHIAARSGNYKHAQLLLFHGANPNATDCHGETTLFWAAGVSDNEHVVQLLLSHGAKMDARGRDGETLLHKAARGGIASTTRFLLAHHANVDALDKFGRTPLRVAMLAGHAEVITQLASFRANMQNNREREMILPRSTDAIDEAISLWSPKNDRSDPNEMTSLDAGPNSMSRELCTTLPHPQSPRLDYPPLLQTPIVDNYPTLNDPNPDPRPVLSKSYTMIPHPRPPPPEPSFPLYPTTGIIGGRAKKDPFAGTYMAYQPPLPQEWPSISPAMGR
jgi:ankyrin repeat protein